MKKKILLSDPGITVGFTLWLLIITMTLHMMDFIGQWEEGTCRNLFILDSKLYHIFWKGCFGCFYQNESVVTILVHSVRMQTVPLNSTNGTVIGFQLSAKTWSILRTHPLETKNAHTTVFCNPSNNWWGILIPIKWWTAPTIYCRRTHNQGISFVQLSTCSDTIAYLDCKYFEVNMKSHIIE